MEYAFSTNLESKEMERIPSPAGAAVCLKYNNAVMMSIRLPLHMASMDNLVLIDFRSLLSAKMNYKGEYRGWRKPLVSHQNLRKPLNFAGEADND